MTRPLGGIRVLDASIYLSGPFATLLLAGLGADVVKVERPGEGDPARLTPPFVGAEGVSTSRAPGSESVTFLKRNRGKRSVAIDLKRPAGRALFRDLARRADVLVENFRPGVMERLGLGYADLAGDCPRLVYCSISGFGRSGPLRDEPALDPVVQAMSGLMALTGPEGGEPLRTGAPLGDLVASLYAVVGILAALREREATGRGRHVDVAMLDGLFSLAFDEPADALAMLGLPLRTGNRRGRLTPNNAYPTRDGHVVVATASDEQWRAVLLGMGRRDLVESGFFARFSDRVEHAAEVDAFVAEWTRARSTDEAVERLRAAGVPCGPVREGAALLSDAQLRSRGMVAPLRLTSGEAAEGLFAYGFPVRFLGPEGGEAAREPGAGAAPAAGFERPAPALGADADAVLAEWLGLGPEEIAALRKEGAL